MTQKTINIILLSLLAVAIIIGVIAIFRKPAQPPVQVQPPGTPPQSGLGGALGSILSNILTADFWKNLFGRKEEYPVVDCDPNRPGFEKDGTANPNCGKNYTGCDPNKCDPNRSGWNECGFLDARC